ncbi:MAG: amidohydrolase [Gemmatimonadetes bacterium]|nr:amidohydrolase [Gemmatimonadota bacterium]NNM07357.1 amidohydrolase [Gemmatimonadota bacterium]
MKTQNHRVDIHYHIIPEPYVQALTNRGITGSTFVKFPKWTPEKALKQMDGNLVETAITSLSTPGVWFGDSDLARRLSRECNEFQAQMMADQPGRFRSLAFLPLPDVDGALAELEYALDDLEHDGVVLLTDTDGQYLGHPDYEELFAELNHRGSVVFIHPHNDPRQSRRYGLFSPLLEWPIHTTRAVMDLLYTGRLARYPNIRYVLAHGGGTLPILAHRIVAGFEHQKGGGASDQRMEPSGEMGVQDAYHLLQRLFYDTAGPGEAHLAALQEFVGPSQVVFGTDGGWTPPVQTAQTIKEVLAYDGFDDRQLLGIERGNAIDLFPRLGKNLNPNEPSKRTGS